MTDVIEEIQKNEEYASPAQLQKEARKRVMDKILKWDPTYVERRKKREEELNKFLKRFGNQERSFYNTGDWALSTNDKRFFEMLETLCEFYETFCKLNKENLTLKEVSNDQLFAEKNKKINELEEESGKLSREKWQMLTLEETERVMDWYAHHIIENDGEHKPVCKMYYGPLGSAREIRCSCGVSFDLKDWEKW